MEFQELKELLEERSLTAAGVARAGKMTKEEAQELIDKYLEQGLLIPVERGKYTTTEKAGILLATIVAIKNNSYYAKHISGEEFHLSGSALKGIILSDQVYIMPEESGREAKYIGFFKRKERLNGNLYRKPKAGYELLSSVTNGSRVKIIVDNDPEEIGAGDGDLVQGRVVLSRSESIHVVLDTLLAKATDVGSDITTIIADKDAPMAFSQEALEEARKIPQVIDESNTKGRVDYRDHLVVTIDGADALDFDDAVEVHDLPNLCYEVIVHIADVSHYVIPNSALDAEAENRGTSIYVADRVVPMLPTEISNGICSLNPDVDRFTLSVAIKIDSRGNVFQSEVHTGVIRSKARLTYTQVNDLLEGQEDVDLPEEIKELIFKLDKVSKLIRKRRMKNGALSLDSTELKFYLDSMGRPLEVAKKTQKEGEKLIEDLMIVANVEVAKMFSKAGIPTLYRIHENPPSGKMIEFKKIASRLGAGKDFPASISPKSLQTWLDSIKDENRRNIVSRMMLRSLAKAKYSPENVGHFGLAEEDYLHFTSPIRRYPDLIVHRAVKEYIINKKHVPNEFFDYLVIEGERTSASERRATEIERMVNSLEAAKYMTKHLEEYYDALITGLTKYGMYVELSNGIDASLEFRYMAGDYFTYDEYKYEVKGRDTRLKLTLGEKIRVISLSADVTTRRVEMCNEEYYRTNVENVSKDNLDKLSEDGIEYQTEDQQRNRYSSSRSSYGNRGSYSSNSRGSYGHRDSGERSSYQRRDDHKSYSRDGDKPSYQRRDGERSSYGRGTSDGERKPYVRRDSNSSSYSRDRKDGERSYSRDRKDGERSSYGQRSGERSSYQRRDSNSSYSRDSKDGERKPYVRRDSSSSSYSRDRKDGDRPSYNRDRNSSSSYSRGSKDGERKSYGSRGSSSSSYSRDRNSSSRTGGDRKPYGSRSGGVGGRSSYSRKSTDKGGYGKRNERSKSGGR